MKKSTKDFRNREMACMGSHFCKVTLEEQRMGWGKGRMIKPLQMRDAEGGD